MKFHQTDPAGQNAFTGYGEGYVLVNGARHTASLIVLPERLIAWGATGFDALAPEDFTELAGMDLEVVLLGTGERLRFPHPRLTQRLAAARVGLEVMDNPAACRTYNILAAESRRVAAALLFA